MQLADIVIFVTSFSKEKINHFREEFLHRYISKEKYYQSPKYTTPALFETENFSEMWDYVLEEEGRSFTFYFENKNNKLCPNGAIQINTDGSLCFVLTVNTDYEEKYVAQLKNSFPEDKCVVSYSYFMPFSIEEFNASK